MDQNVNWTALGFIAVGTLFSLGRGLIAKWYVQLHAWLTKQSPNPRLEAGVSLYLVMMAMIFTVAGILGLFKIIPM